MNPARQHGITLMEMLIVVILIGMLAAIALPSYRDYVLRTNRTVAKVALQDLLARQEGYATDHKRYAASFAALGLTGGSGTTAYVTGDGAISLSSGNALYSLSLHGNSAGTMATCALSGSPGVTGFRISATPVVATGDSRCGTICLSSNGDRGSSAGDAASCWRR